LALFDFGSLTHSLGQRYGSARSSANGGGDRGRPKLERQKFEPAIIVDELERGVEDAEAKKGGGRKLLSSVGGE